MPTLQALIAAHEARQPVESRPILTPRGLACARVVRLEQTLADLDRADRAYVMGRLRDLLADLDA